LRRAKEERKKNHFFFRFWKVLSRRQNNIRRVFRSPTRPLRRATDALARPLRGAVRQRDAPYDDKEKKKMMTKKKKKKKMFLFLALCLVARVWWGVHWALRQQARNKENKCENDLGHT
jgi:hypothetical protein